MKSLNKYFFLLFAFLTVVTIDVKAAAKAGEATVKVNATTTVSLATTYQTTLRNSTGISARWSTSSSNISITSQSNTSATIKGVSAGTAQLNYYCSYYIDGYYRTMDFYYTITIESSGSTSNITISPTSITLDEGDTYSVTAYQPGYQGGVYFTSNNSNIADVSTGNSSGYYTYGTVTAISAGTTYIYAKSMNGATSSACTITVRAKTITPTRIVLPGSKTIEEGEYDYITASVSPSNATYSISWSSSDTDVATISSTGRVYGKKPGTARITAKINGYSLSDFCDVTVKAKQVIATKLSIEDPSSLPLGESFQLMPIFEPNNATTEFSYISNNESVVTVSSTGLITAVGVGNATVTITETISKLTSSIEINVPEQEMEDTDISLLENALYIEKTNGNPGAIVDLNIKLKNIIIANGCAFNLTLPDNFSLLTDESGDVVYKLSYRAKKMMVFSKNWKDGNYDFALIPSESSATITGTDDIFITFKLFIPNDADGDYKLFLTDNLVLTMVDEIVQDKMMENIVSTLCVSEEYEPDNGDEEPDTDISQLDNVIYIEGIETHAGAVVDLNVKLKNSITANGCSFKLTLPEGFRLSVDEDGDVIYEMANRARKMSVTYKDWKDGSYDFALQPSSSTATISDTEGTFITFKMIIPEDAENDYKLRLTKNLIQTYVNGAMKDEPLEDVITTLHVSMYPMGDVNHSGDVTPADAIMILYHFFGVEQSGFYKNEAYLTPEDKDITPADAIEALYIYFRESKKTTPKQSIIENQTLDPQ